MPNIDPFTLLYCAIIKYKPSASLALLKGNTIFKFCLFVVIGTFLYGADGDIATTPLSNNYKLPYSGPVSKPELVWKTQLSQRAIESIVTIDKDGTLYAGSNDGHVYAINPSTGALIWKFKTKNDVKSSVITNKQGVLLFGSMDGYLYALDKNGTLKWKYNAKSAISATPNIDNEDDIIIGDTHGYFHVLDSNGKPLYRFKLSLAIEDTAVVDQHNHIYLGLNREIISFQKNGVINWRYKTKNAITNTLVLSGTIILASSKDWSLYALNKEGTLRWAYRTAWYMTASPVVANDRVYFGSWDWSIHAANLSNGEGIWSTQPERSPNMSYFASNIIVDKNENIYAASRNDGIYCFDKRGKVLWSLKLKGEDVVGGLSLLKDGTLIVPTTKGNIYAFSDKYKMP